jgi:hypothetical protein
VHLPRLAVIAALGASLTFPAAAQPIRVPDLGIVANRVPLACAIELEKEFVLTNTTAGPIAAGTPIFIEVVRFPDGAHNVLNYHGPEVPVGGIVREGIYQATSCTAWIEVEPLTLMPSAPARPIGPRAPLGDLPARNAP